LSPQQLVACLQQCPDTQRGVACRKSCIHEHDKVKSACKRPPFIAPGPLAYGPSASTSVHTRHNGNHARLLAGA
jgi:hypothetical protein